MIFSRWTERPRPRHGRPMLGLMLLATAWLTGSPALAAGIVGVLVS